MIISYISKKINRIIEYEKRYCVNEWAKDTLLSLFFCIYDVMRRGWNPTIMFMKFNLKIIVLHEIRMNFFLSLEIQFSNTHRHIHKHNIYICHVLIDVSHIVLSLQDFYSWLLPNSQSKLIFPLARVNVIVGIVEYVSGSKIGLAKNCSSKGDMANFWDTCHWD